jgi:transcriptional regulator with XRE-family HTH domain
MSEYSLSAPERARKIASHIRQAVNLAESQKALATAMGVSEATINRLLNDHLENFAAVLAQLGQKVVPVDHKCVDRATYDFLTKSHARIMERAPHLIWDVEE